MSNSGTICTGEGVTMFQLLALKGAMRLESIGMKHSSGALRPKWAKQLGLKARAPHADFIKAIEKKIKESEARLQPGDIQAV